MTLCCSCIYISSGCNRSPNTLDWGRNGMICYSSCNTIHLWKYEAKQYFHHFQTLLGHKKLVTSVHWIRNSDQENELVSTSADHTAIIWTLQENLFVKSNVLLGHTDVVQNACGMHFTQNSTEFLFIATLSTDSTLKVWKCFEDKTDCMQTISFGNGFGLDVKFSSLNDSNELIMLVGADDCRIHIFTQDDHDCFNKVLSLEGHENWIQSLDIIDKDNNTKLIASASQDCYIRIWKIVTKESLTKLTTTDYLKLDEALFNVRKGYTYLVFLESVLSGHENWIYSVQWCFPKSASPLQLLSTSMDKTMIIWESDCNSNIWTEKIRVGEVGGNTLGLYGGVFSPCGKVIIAHGYQGAIHMWKLNKELGDWVPGITFGGHFAPVLDIDWDPEGKYLISCSSDKTTRIHAQYVTSYGESDWYEIARPQVHGYNMGCLAIVNRFKFVSAGGEKVIRAFVAPKNFTEALKNIAKVDTSTDVMSAFAEGASVPSLGLSNKAVFEENLNEANSLNRNDLEKHPKDCYPDFYYTPICLTAPPTEEILIQNTLWPEVQKLYGHPYEVYSLASNHSGTLIASACKASKPEHAAITLWDTTSWLQVCQLVFHNLTVTQLEFSPDDEFLLSVSRDRMWAVYRHCPSESPLYRKIANLAKKNSVHTRIIWSCSWTFDNLYFATGSRDKKIAVWGRTRVGSEVGFPLCTQQLEVEDSATALSFAPSLTSGKYLLAVGLENGGIVISTWCKYSGFSIHQKLSENIAHHLTINRLKFSPVIVKGDIKQNISNIVQLASCSNDNHVKIYNIIMSL